MNKDTLSMVKQILMDEESLDQLREKLEHEKIRASRRKSPVNLNGSKLQDVITR